MANNRSMFTNNEAMRYALINLSKRGITMQDFAPKPCKKGDEDKEMKRVRSLSVTLNVIASAYYNCMTGSITKAEAKTKADASWQKYINPTVNATNWDDLADL